MINNTAQIQVALLDDHAVVRIGTASRLAEEPDILIVGSYATSHSMIKGLRETPADVLVVDYALGPDEIDGVSLIRTLATQFPKAALLVFSSHYEPATVALALRVGARGFVGKRQDMTQLVRAIRALVTGAVFLDEEMTYRLADSKIPPAGNAGVTESAPQTGLTDMMLDSAKLSVKEREVIRCFLAGMSVSEIAVKFKRSAKTISTQKSMAFRKLGISSDIELFKLGQLHDAL
ncbi:response regulator transcription factor [Achromobacter xylosoxidans]|uniref:response regulator transcription factor n=1 Tax=Alcaligenes xylosoxydans xylosoxydans TaxID=85698 RepID=UPI0006C166F1|nr:response regulator transcription factor [Achromobacter xylosoxidans]CUI59347.1 Transcriptional regulatory protein uhpA [Achromobacter xylosoxidans]